MKALFRTVEPYWSMVTEAVTTARYFVFVVIPVQASNG